MISPVGVINIGSNSAKLFVSDGSKLGYRRSITCQLSRGMKDGVLADDAIRRTADAVKSLYTESLSLCKEGVLLYATEAVRSALNGDEVLRLIKDGTGLTCEVIDGEEEALCSYLGAAAYFDGIETLIDIGGASTEIVTADGGKITSRRSYPTGAVRLTDLGGQDYEKLFSLASEVFSDIEKNTQKHIVGASGTFCSLAAAALNLKEYDENKIHGYILTPEKLSELVRAMSPMTPEQIREEFPSVTPLRANVLKAGLAILGVFVEKFSRPVTVSVADGLLGYRIRKTGR